MINHACGDHMRIALMYFTPLQLGQSGLSPELSDESYKLITNKLITLPLARHSPFLRPRLLDKSDNSPAIMVMQ